MSNDSRNLLVASFLAILVLVGWNYFVEQPKQIERARQAKQLEFEKKKAEQPNQPVAQQEQKIEPLLKRADAISTTERITIESPTVQGSIALKGARFDDLTLVHYKETLDSDSPSVTLLSPSNSFNAFFAEVGWLSTDKNLTLPTATTQWSADRTTLAPNNPVTLSWVNPEGVRFNIHVALDDQYIFTLTRSVENTLASPITIAPYGLISRLWTFENPPFFISHEGPLAVIDKALLEYDYDDIKEDGRINFKQNDEGWIGITDKYWLTSIIPQKDTSFDLTFSHYTKQRTERFQVDYLSPSSVVQPNETFTLTEHLFVGAKKVHLLDQYAEKHDIELFDLAIDFGYFYFFTKPLFLALQFIHSYVGNLGIAILLLTVLVKLVMFPLANKSYISMSKMKKLQPEIMELRQQYATDSMRMNKEIMELYSRQQVNPLAGCLPILIQIPVFFCLYKVLFVTIEMRHAPFFGWIKDLSAPDPTTIFNLFGMIPWDPPIFLSIGAWPIFMCITMYLQQRMNPEPSDPIQAKVMRLLPLLFLFMFQTFPAGLIIYWAWNNVLSILQQWTIMRKLNREDNA